jgi:hypothetical protein
LRWRHIWITVAFGTLVYWAWTLWDNPVLLPSRERGRGWCCCSKRISFLTWHQYKKLGMTLSVTCSDLVQFLLSFWANLALRKWYFNKVINFRTRIARLHDVWPTVHLNSVHALKQCVTQIKEYFRKILILVVSVCRFSMHSHFLGLYDLLSFFQGKN